MQKAVFLAITLAAVALAGCTDEPPSGTFTATTPAVDFSVAGLAVTVQPAENPYPAGDDDACQLDDVFGNVPDGPTCSDAVSTINMTPEGGTTLPEIGTGTPYSLYLMAGGEEYPLGNLDDHGQNHFDFSKEFPGEDFSGADEIQLRFGTAVVATTPGSGGTFSTLSEGLEAISAEVTFDGAQIDVTLTGVPNGTQLTAWLVDIPEEEGEDGEMVEGAPVHSVQFILSGDQTSYTLTEEEGFVGDYNEFHIHVGNSKINVAVAPIPQSAK